MQSFVPRPGSPAIIGTLGVLAAVALGAAPTAADPLAPPAFDRGAVVTVHRLATAAGVETLQAGGNAVDAAVAAGLVLGVVDGHNSGLGGGCLMLVRGPDGSIVAIDGRETAPAAATRDMFLRDGQADPAPSRTGPLAVATPGQVAAFHDAVTSFGRLPWRDHCRRAARIAAEGFTVSENYATRVRSVRDDLAADAGSRAIFLREDGTSLQAGDLLRQPDLARSLEALGEQGPDWFYRGDFARQVDGWMRQRGGILTAEDLAGYRAPRREPVVAGYRGRSIVGFPPPSSGGIHVGQILGILDRFDLAALSPDSVDFRHTVVEAMKLAFADRARWLGDADVVPVPRGLLDPEYLAGLATGIDPGRATPVAAAGEPPRAGNDLFPPAGHTTHFAAADAGGWWVACTATVNTAFGAKVVVPGTGIVLNNEMDDFVAEPGVRNAFGLVGGEANAIAPRKRPLSSMAPTLVLEDGRPVMATGAAGGPTIISQVVLGIVHSLDFGASPAEALARPRFHHQWSPDRVRLERAAGADAVAELEARGHVVDVVEGIGAANLLARPAADGPFTGAAEPRIPEAAFGGW